MMKLTYLSVIALLLSSQSFAKVANLEDEDLELENYLASKNSQTRSQASVAQAVKIESHELMHKLGPHTQFAKRGLVELSKDAGDKIVSVSVLNEFDPNKQDNYKATLQEACSKNHFYHLYIPDFDILTSIPACQYLKQGLNETLTFSSDSAGGLSGFQFDFIDNQYLASLEKHPRKKRILSTVQFDALDTTCRMQMTAEGTRPIFNKYKYDSTGRELQQKAPVKEGEEPQEEQSFLRKYWLYILLAFMILPNLLGGAEEPGQPAAAAVRK